jgi:hypothetical protein
MIPPIFGFLNNFLSLLANTENAFIAQGAGEYLDEEVVKISTTAYDEFTFLK